VYVGTSIPFDDIEYIYNDFKPDFFLTFFTVVPSELPLQGYINRIASTFPATKIVVGGAQIMFNPVDLPKNVYAIRSCEQLLELLRQ